jgi:hypothetical protein
MPEDHDDAGIVRDDEVEGPSELFEPLQKIKEVAQFWRTRSAILNGDPIYDYGKKRLENEKLLGPWQFNLIESTIAGLPALIIPFCSHVIAHLQGISASKPLTEPDNILSEVLQSFSVPFILMLMAYVVGRACLRKRDGTTMARRRAGRVFLYLDGAYGFYPQLALTAAFTVLLLNPELSPVRSYCFWLGIWQLFIYMKTIPSELFHAVGYANAYRDLSPNAPIKLFATHDTISVDPTISHPDPPLWKYRLCVLFVIPAISLGVIAVILFVSAIVTFVWGRLIG